MARSHALLHDLWSEAVDRPGYDKSAWLELEALLTSPVGYTCSAFALFAQLRDDGDRWDELEQLVFSRRGRSMIAPHGR